MDVRGTFPYMHAMYIIKSDCPPSVLPISPFPLPLFALRSASQHFLVSVYER